MNVYMEKKHRVISHYNFGFLYTLVLYECMPDIQVT